MRPIEIRIEGFRSFRQGGETIRWQDEELIAIVGDTGSGKSSILEAMTFALYGQTSIPGQQLRDLINDEADCLDIEFRFWASDNNVWRACRSTTRRAASREAGPQAATLTCYGTSDEVIESIEGVRAVNERVVQLLGLDHRAFLRTMVLPQGRFAALLASDDQKGRAETLRQIWRTADIDAAGDILKRSHELAGKLADRLEWERSREPEDLDAALRDLEATAAESERKRAAAEKAASRIEDLSAEADRADADAGRQKEHARLLGERETTLGTELDGAIDEIRRAEQLIEERGDRLAALPAAPATEATAAELADELGRTARWLDAVERLRDTVDLIRRGRAAAARSSAVETAGRTELADRTAAAETARRNLADTQEREAQVRKIAEAAEAAERAGADRERGLELRYRAPLERLGTALAETRAALETETAEHDSAVRKLQEADGRLATATAEERSIRNRAHVHEAAAEAIRGEPCPVCGETLGPRWRRPTAPVGLEEAVRRRDELDRRRVAATSLRDRTLAAKVARAARLKELERDEAELATGLAEETNAGGTVQVERLRDTAAKAGERLQAAEAATAEAARTAEAATNRMQTARADAREATERARGDAERLQEVRQRCRAVRAELPERWRPAGEEPEQAALDEVAVELTVARGRLMTARDAAERSERAARERAEAEKDLTAARGRHREAVAAAVGIWRRAWQTAHDAGADEQEGDAPKDSRSAERCARRVVKVLGERRAELSAGAGRLAGEAVNKREEAARRAVGAGWTNGPGGPARQAARGRAGAAEAAAGAAEAARRFRRRVPGVRDLERLGREMRQLAARLAEGDRSLKAGAFPKWLTLRRSKVLLAQANRHLGTMTRGRYQFRDPEETREQWVIADAETNGTRQPASLSGGEQFIAALALSLGMVETVGRRGGRLESFFLDEGFGTLDADALETAVTALESAAGPDHLVGVITHVREVAERMPHVLAVRNDPLYGTKGRWLDSRQRRELAESGNLTRIG